MRALFLVLLGFVCSTTGTFTPEADAERLFKTNPHDLNIIFVGDPQYHFPCTEENDECKQHSKECRDRNGLNVNDVRTNKTGVSQELITRLEQECIKIESTFANQVQRKSIFSLNRALKPKPAVMVINGDLTNYGHLEQFQLFKDEWLTMPIPILPLLGNHDYENNVNDCVANQCANRMLYWFVKYGKEHNFNLDYVKSQEFLFKSVYTGSFAYSKDVCNKRGDNCVHLIQINNRPDYVAHIRAVSDWDIRGAFQWLRGDLNAIQNRSEPIYINMHQMTPQVDERLQVILKEWINQPENRGINLRIAVLYAHWHNEHKFIDKCIDGLAVHYMFVGSVPHQRYTTMKFLSDGKIEAYLLHSRNNLPTEIVETRTLPWGKC